MLPRDLLLSLSAKSARAAEANESDKALTFSHYWKSGDESFFPIKEQYERILKSIPDDDKIQQWKELVGID